MNQYFIISEKLGRRLVRAINTEIRKHPKWKSNLELIEYKAYIKYWHKEKKYLNTVQLDRI